MKYIAFPIDEIDTVMEICVGEVNRYKDILKDSPYDIPALSMRTKWEGKVEALQEMMKFGTECNEIK